MSTPDFQRFNQFALDLAAGVHDLQTAGSTLKVCLTNTAPDKSADAVLADITQIAYTNITETVPADVTNVGVENSAGKWDVTGTDITLNATGTVAKFRYVVLFNDTPTSPADPVIGFWDYGSGGVTLVNGDTFDIEFGNYILRLG